MSNYQGHHKKITVCQDVFLKNRCYTPYASLKYVCWAQEVVDRNPMENERVKISPVQCQIAKTHLWFSCEQGGQGALTLQG